MRGLGHRDPVSNLKRRLSNGTTADCDITRTMRPYWRTGSSWPPTKKQIDDNGRSPRPYSHTKRYTKTHNASDGLPTGSPWPNYNPHLKSRSATAAADHRDIAPNDLHSKGHSTSSITIKSGDSSWPRGQHLSIKTHLNLNKTNLNSNRPITAQDSKRRREKLGHMQISSTSRPITELLTNSVRQKRGKAACRQTSKEFDTTSKEHQRTLYRTFSYYSSHSENKPAIMLKNRALINSFSVTKHNDR